VIDIQDFMMWALWIILCIGCLALIPAGFIIHNRNKPIHDKKINPAVSRTALTIQMQQAATEIPEEERTWFLEQAAIAGFDLNDPAPRLKTVPVRRETLNLSGGTPIGQIIEIGDTKYQKLGTTNGYFYLKKVCNE
jgi:hypothetical protein